MHADPVAPYVVFRNHVTQAMAFAAAALFAVLLALQPETGRRWRVVAWGAAAVLVFSLVATTAGRSGYVVMAIVAIALAMTQRRGRARMAATAGVLAVLVVPPSRRRSCSNASNAASASCARRGSQLN